MGASEPTLRASSRPLAPNAARDQILSLILEHPGIRYRELLRATGKSRGTVSHHLRALVRAGRAHRATYHRFTCFFAADAAPAVRASAPALRSPMARWIYEQVRARPSITARVLASERGVHPSSILQHVHRLLGAGLIRRTRTRAGLELRVVEDPGLPRPRLPG